MGPKAACLQKLMAAGVPVPAGFCILRSAYDETVWTPHQSELQALADSGCYAQIHDHVRDTVMASALRAKVLAAYEQLQVCCPGPVAVRSSSTAEDQSGHSFAGLYDTILHVTGEQALLEAIRQCWASYWSEEAALYRDRLGMEHSRHGMAVLVQTMIQPRLAGVLFTRAPTGAGQQTMLLEFVLGEGAALVGGDVQGERLLIDRVSGQPVETPPATNYIAPSLVRRLVSLGLMIEDLQGTPQDIEWCVAVDDDVWILQARPITGLAEAKAGSPRVIPSGWQRVYDEAFSPLGCELAVRRHERWVAAIGDYYHTRFKVEAQTTDGWVYCTTPWRSPASLLRAWMALWKVIRWLQANRIQREFEQVHLPAHVRERTELEQLNLSALDNQSLLHAFNRGVDLYLHLQYSSYPIGATAVIAASFFDRVCRLLLPKTSDPPGSAFLGGLENVTTDRDLALQRLGNALGEALAPEEVADLDYAGLLTLQEQSDAGRRFWNELRAFQDTYGYVWADRYPRDPAWEINAEALMVSLIDAVHETPDSGLAVGHMCSRQRRIQAVELASRRLSGFPLSLRWRIFRGFCERAQRSFPHKENRNHYVYRAAMVIRRLALEMGRRLKAKGVLQTETNIFFLTCYEIEKAMSDGCSTAAVVGQVQLRKEIYYSSRQQALDPASRTGALCTSSRGDGKSQNELRGEPCSPGVATGAARLVSGPGEFHRIQTGDIVVCRHLRPAWSPIFARIAGIAIEEGGVLSHGATLAREYGVPAVINVPGIIRMVNDGCRLTIDGDRGVVTMPGPYAGKTPVTGLGSG